METDDQGIISGRFITLRDGQAQLIRSFADDDLLIRQESHGLQPVRRTFAQQFLYGLHRRVRSLHNRREHGALLFGILGREILPDLRGQVGRGPLLRGVGGRNRKTRP